MSTTPPGKGEVPNCKCHGEPMLWQKHPRYTAGGYWHCRIKNRARLNAYYYSMPGTAYNRRLLLGRRSKALKRMKARAA